MYHTSLYRNDRGIGNKIIAQIAYGLTAVVAMVESIAALIFLAFSAVAYLFSPELLANATKWIGSSTFSIIWAVADFILNPFVSPLVADEQSARSLFKSGRLFQIPASAVIR